MNKRVKLYTQWRNECTIYTILNILRTKYRIILNDQQIAKLIADAEAAWIWSREGWAVFKFIYNWFTGRFYKEFWIEIEVEDFDILSKIFEERTLEWESWALWLLFAWKFYREVREDWEITLEEIQNSEVEDYNFYWHNFFWKLWYIVWILRSIPYDKKYIRFKLEALREWVRKGFFWQTARTFSMKDKLLEKYLINLNRDVEYENTEELDEKNRKALDLALKLRIIKK